MKKRIVMYALICGMLATAGCTNKNADMAGDVATETTTEATAEVTAEVTAEATAEATPETTAEATPETAEPVTANMTVMWDSEVEGGIDSVDYIEYRDEAAEEAPGVVFMTDAKVTDFTLLDIAYAEDAPEGEVGFNVTERKCFDELTPERPLLTGFAFIGEIPNNAISYIDGTGEKKAFAVTESGMDGALMLIELVVVEDDYFVMQ